MIANLISVSEKKTRRIIGLMSGTSLDGLDVALCELQGAGIETKVRILKFETVPYTEEEKDKIRRVFAKKSVDFQYLVLLNEWVGIRHGEIVNLCLAKWGVPAPTVDAVASHGQTVFHAPRSLHGLDGWPNGTLQIGDGDHVAMTTGILTLSDFRQKHIAAGGEGAPLVAYGDYLIFTKPGETRLMLNIGGVANFTYLPGSGDASEVFATDTGPGNTLLDAFTQELFNLPFDKDSALARQGRISEPLLDALKAHPFFLDKFPKTTGPELFNKGYVKAAQASTGTEDLSGVDLLATLTAFSADTIADALETVSGPVRIFGSGGGIHNPFLMELLSERFSGIAPTDTLGIPGDAKEAVLFAVLANETLSGSSVNYTQKSLGMFPVSMGKISIV